MDKRKGSRTKGNTDSVSLYNISLFKSKDTKTFIIRKNKPGGFRKYTPGGFKYQHTPLERVKGPQPHLAGYA